MLGSNPSADSVASTDPGGCCAIPLSSVCRHRARIGRGTKAQNPGGAGAKPLRHSLLPLRKPASSHNACIGQFPLIERIVVSTWTWSILEARAAGTHTANNPTTKKQKGPK